MTHVPNPPARRWRFAVVMVLLLVIPACRGTGELPSSPDGQVIQQPSPTSTAVVATSTPDLPEATTTLPVQNTPVATATTSEPSTGTMTVDAVLVRVEAALTREGSVYHVAIEQVITGLRADGIPRWSGDLWLDLPNNVARSDVRLYPDIPEDTGWMVNDAASRPSTAVFHGNTAYIAFEGLPLLLDTVLPCHTVPDFTLLAYLICRSPVSAWTGPYSIGSLEKLRIVERTTFNGKAALALSYDEAGSTALFIDAETYLPLGWRHNALQMVTLETIYEGSFVEAASLDSQHFDPVSIGYVQPPLASGSLLVSRGAYEDWSPVIVHADGSGETILIERSGLDISPTSSPDGHRIAFVSDRDGNLEIYSMNPDGSDPVNLSNHPSVDTDPVWSPDGQRILFVSDRAEQFLFQLYVMNADGSNVQRLSEHAWPQDASWSPDGSQIAFVATSDQPALYVIAADGSDEVRIPHSTFGPPSWTSDDSRLVYTALVGENMEIVSTQRDGADVINLTNSPDNEFLLSVSPDGTRIALLQHGDSLGILQDIAVMDIDGSNRILLAGGIESPSCYAGCVWSPDGLYLAYSILPQVGQPAIDAEAVSPGESVMQPSGMYLAVADGSLVIRLDAADGYIVEWMP